MKAILGGLVVLYFAIGSIHSMAFGLFVSPKTCTTARGIVYIYCNYGFDVSGFVITMAWPLYWLQRAEAGTQHLTGTDRSDFIAGTVNSCMREYETKGTAIPRPFAQEYCQCYATGLVDRLLADDLKDADSPIANAAIQTESKRCYQVIKDHAMRSLGQQ